MLTKAWAAQDHIVNGLKALPGMAGVACDLGFPIHLEEDHVWLAGEIDTWSFRDGVSGLGARDEEFRLRLCIYVKRSGADYDECRDRVETIGNLVQGFLDTGWAVGGSNMDVARIVQGQMDETAFDTTREVMLSLWINVRTWTT